MALGDMKFTQGEVAMTPEILYNAEYVGDAVTLDTAAFTNGLCKAGTPIASTGKKAVTTEGSSGAADTSDAVGILLHDVYGERPQGTIVIGGYINTSKAQTHSGVTYDAATKAALKNVVFC